MLNRQSIITGALQVIPTNATQTMMARHGIVPMDDILTSDLDRAVHNGLFS